jgi:hypothetical protein
MMMVHWLASGWQASVGEECETLRRHVEELERARSLLQSKPAAVADQPRQSAAAARLRGIAAAIPRELWLVGYRERRGEATLRGVSLSNEAPRDFVDALAKAAVFDDIEITETARATAKSAREDTEALYEFEVRARARPAVPIGGGAPSG